MLEELLRSLPVEEYGDHKFSELIPLGTRPYPIPHCEVNTQNYKVQPIGNESSMYACCEHVPRKIYIKRPDFLGTELWYHILYHETAHIFYKDIFTGFFDVYYRCLEELIAESTATLLSYQNGIYDVIEPLNSMMLSQWMSHMVVHARIPIPYHEIATEAQDRAVTIGGNHDRNNI